MTHTTASSVGGFLSSLPPSNRAGNWNAFTACLIYSSSSLRCKEGKLPLAHEQSTVIPELLLQRTNRNEGARSGEEQKGSQLSKFSRRLSEKEAIVVFFFSCFEIIKPHKRPFSETGLLQSHKACSEEWWGLTSEEARRGAQSRNTCSQYFVPVLLYIKTKAVQLSIFQRIVTKKGIIKNQSCTSPNQVSERANKESI